MSCISVASGLIFRCDLFESSGNVEVRQSPVEQSERGLGLVVGYFVARLVHTEEADCERVSVSIIPKLCCQENIQLPYCLTSPYSVPSTTNGS